MTQLLVLECFVDHQVAIDGGDGDLCVCGVPAERVDDLLFKFCLCRVEVCIIDLDELHARCVPHAHRSVVRARSNQILVRRTVLHTENGLKVPCFSLELCCLPFEIVHRYSTIFESIQDTRPNTAFAVEEDHVIGALGADLVCLTGFVASNVPVMKSAYFVVCRDKVSRPICHPHDVVDGIWLFLKALHNAGLLREALK